MKTPFYMGILAALALTACAPDTPGQKAAKDRHEKMEEMGDAFKALGDEAKKASPDAALMAKNAVIVADMAESLPGWFPAGSGPQDGVKTEAKADAWEKTMEFADTIRKFQAQTQELRAVANDGPEAIGAQVADVGKECKSCHDQYREKRE